MTFSTLSGHNLDQIFSVWPSHSVHKYIFFFCWNLWRTACLRLTYLKKKPFPTFFNFQAFINPFPPFPLYYLIEAFLHVSSVFFMSFSRSFNNTSPYVTSKCGFTAIASISADLGTTEVIP